MKRDPNPYRNRLATTFTQPKIIDQCCTCESLIDKIVGLCCKCNCGPGQPCPKAVPPQPEGHGQRNGVASAK